MKRKLWLSLCSALFAGCMLFAFTACADGKDGANGKSAYEIWLENGYTGTQADFLEWLKGQNGVNGVGVKSVEIDKNGHLIITLTDGTTLDAGKLPSSGSGSGSLPDYTVGLAYREVAHPVTGGKAYEVTGIGSAPDLDIVIPETYNGTPVISIAARAFSQRNIRSITIPDSVTSIGNGAFTWCSSLTHVMLGTGVTSIGNEVFSSCTSLTNITIPNSVTSIGNGAFYWCFSLTDITIPNSVTSIGEQAFCLCTSLTSITIPDSVTSIGNEAFMGCMKLIEIWNDSALNIAAGSSQNGYVAYYAKHVYTQGEPSKQIVTPDHYRFYEDGNEVYLLEYAGNDTEIILPEKSPSGKQYGLYTYAFHYRSITSVTIGAGVTSIGQYAFGSCYSLTSVTFEAPNGWRANGISLNLNNPTQNAEYLKNTYCAYSWTKN